MGYNSELFSDSIFDHFLNPFLNYFWEGPAAGAGLIWETSARFLISEYAVNSARPAPRKRGAANLKASPLPPAPSQAACCWLLGDGWRLLAAGCWLLAPPKSCDPAHRPRGHAQVEKTAPIRNRCCDHVPCWELGACLLPQTGTLLCPGTSVCGSMPNSWILCPRQPPQGHLKLAQDLASSTTRDIYCICIRVFRAEQIGNLYIYIYYIYIYIMS